MPLSTSIGPRGIRNTDGQGNPHEGVVTKISVEVAGEKIVIEDENGIEVSKDPETGRPLVKADSIEVASEQNPPHSGGKEIR